MNPLRYWKEMLVAGVVVVFVSMYWTNERQAKTITRLNAVVTNQGAVAEMDRLAWGALKDEKEENDNLRADVERGAKRLRVAATCPTPGVGDGQGAELDPGARSDYYALRNGIITQQAKINFLQDYVIKQQKIIEDMTK